MQIEPLSCCCCSSELWNCGDITLERSVVNIGAVVVHEWHHWLVHGAVPLHEAWVSVSIPVHILMVLVIDWLLASPPLTVGIGHWWVSWENTGGHPLAKVWMVSQCLGVEGVIPHHNWTVVSQTTTSTSNNVVHDPGVGKSNTSVEVLDWKLTNGEESESNSELSSGSVVSEVEVGLVGWSGDLLALSSWEPTSDSSHLGLDFVGPLGETLL